MKKLSIAALLCCAMALAGSGAAADLNSPVGVWKTVDDKTGMPRALVRIYLEDGKYFGKI